VLGAALPHQAGPELRVLELLDEAGDLLLVALGQQRVRDRREQRQVLDALRRPVGLDLGGVDAPDLLGVGLEEDAVQPPAEAGRDPALEVALVLGRPDAHERVREHAAHGLQQPEAAQGVAGLERVVEQLAAVVDAAHPRAEQELLVGQDLVPERLDLGHLGEEAVPADVEAPAVRSTVRLIPPTTSEASSTTAGWPALPSS
jgi:hypothetical protein